MRKEKLVFIFILFAAVLFPAAGQTHLSVPLGHPVYTVIEQAQMRGLSGILPGARPYSRSQILLIIEDILSNNSERRFGGLTDREISILEEFKKDLNPPRGGFDSLRGTISWENNGKEDTSGIYISAEFGFGFDFHIAGSFFPVAGGYRYREGISDPLFRGAEHPEQGSFHNAFNAAFNVHFKGDLGRNTSYGIQMSLRALRAPRTVLGLTTSDYGWIEPERPDNKFHGEGRDIYVFSDPLAYFPFSHRRTWDGHLYSPRGLHQSGQLIWPQGFSLGYNMFPELAGTFLNNHVRYRVARVDREWGGMAAGSSLVLNQSAQPFLAAELTISPFQWISFSSLTGRLEFGQADISQRSNYADIHAVAAAFQNMFSILKLEVNINNFFQIDFGTSVIFPNRFEFGYIFPFMDNLVHQNSIGDFDNLGLFLNLQGQYPGIGRLWFSFFLDEGNPFGEKFFQRTRNMFAYQLGAGFHVPGLPFSSITFSYTRIRPYTYTHIRTYTPWYDDTPMETNWVNFGRPLGHYLPPNSDEFLIRFETIPMSRSLFSIQYQLVRRGADFGNRQVAGSNINSELGGRRNRYYQFFLRDGAYQWLNIVRLRGEYSFAGRNVPVRAFAEIGAVYSFFTDIDAGIPPNSGAAPAQRAHSFRRINTPEYPRQLSFIAMFGLRIFPKF